MGSTMDERSSKETSKNTRSLMKRRDGLVKKASELATLCGADVCLICYSSIGDRRLITWTSDESTVRSHIDRFSEAKRAGLVKQSIGPRESMLNDERKIEKQNRRQNQNQNVERETSSGVSYAWHPVLDTCSRISLTRLASHIKEKLSMANQKISSVRSNRSVENQIAVTDDNNSINNSGSSSIKEHEIVNCYGGGRSVGDAQRIVEVDDCNDAIGDRSNYDFMKEVDVLKSDSANYGYCGCGSGRPTKIQKFVRNSNDSHSASDDGLDMNLRIGTSTVDDYATRNREQEQRSPASTLYNNGVLGQQNIELPIRFMHPLIRTQSSSNVGTFGS